MGIKSAARHGFSLAQKLAALAAGLGLLMTVTFTVLNAVQMRAAVTDNYSHTLEAVVQVRETLLHQQYAHLQEMLVLSRHGAGVPPQAEQLYRLLEENTSSLPLGAQLVFVDKAGEVLAPALPMEHSLSDLSALLEKAAETKQVMTWSGPRGEFIYRAFFFAPEQWYVVCLMPLDSLEKILSRRTQQMAATGLALTLLGLVLAFLTGRRLTAPLRSLNKAAQTLPELDISAAKSLETLSLLLPDGAKARGDEVGALARSFDHMTRELHENVCRLMIMGQEQARLQSELHMARSIQDGMLPHAFPEDARLDVHGCVLPAREVGGDFYDVFMLDEHQFCFVVGDVSDKGMPAALVMSMILCLTRSLLRQRAGETPDVAGVLAEVNDALCRDNPRNMFATMIVGVLDCRSGCMRWANAGHLPPLRLRTAAVMPDAPAGSGQRRLCVETLPTSKDMVAGAFEEVVYSTFSCDLAPGDRVLLYTDGVTEALRADGQRWGDLEQHLGGIEGSASEVDLMIIERIQAFVCGAPQADDITLQNFLWRGPQE